MKTIILILSLLFGTISLSAQFKSYSEKSKIYSFPVDFEKLPKTELISIATYNEFFVNYKFGEQYYYNVKGEYDDDDVARYVSETSKYITLDNDSNEIEAIYNNKLYLLGKLNLSDKYETLIFKIEQYRDEYILLNNYSISGNLLSAICLFFKERDGLDIIYSSLNKENKIIQNTVAETVDMDILQKMFVLDSDGHFRVIKSYFGIEETLLSEEVVRIPVSQQILPTLDDSKQTHYETEKRIPTIKYTQQTFVAEKNGKQIYADPGDYLVGEVKDGKVIQGTLYDKDGNVKEIIIEKRNH